MQLFVLFFLLLLLTNVRTQTSFSSCTCSCCRSFTAGQQCNPSSLPHLNSNIQPCTLETCLGQCRANYFECQGTTGADQIIAECNNTANSPPFNCRCDCCNTGSNTCVPYFVGNTRAYSCQTGACSVACEQQYPDSCKAGRTGVTHGTCTDYIPTPPITITSTTTTTTMSLWLGNTCECTWDQLDACGSTIFYGVTSASYCSSDACTRACRDKYSIIQLIGRCISDNAAVRLCSCRCWETSKSTDYKVSTNDTCTECNGLCRKYSPCDRNAQVLVLSCSNITNSSYTLSPLINVMFITFLFIFFSSY